jgi:hypothetical protein
MSYKLIRADDLLERPTPKPRVFMGGQVRGRDWRNDFFQRFEKQDVTFVSPKRDTFVDPEFDPAGHAKQVEWERHAMDSCEIGVFWLGEGLSNQAARVEMGYILGQGKPLLVGAEKGFMGMEHLSAFGGLVLATTLEGLMGRFDSLLSGYKTE